MRFQRAFVVVVMSVVCLSIAVGGPASDGTAYGKPLSGTDTIDVAKLLGEADKHVGETVRIEGVVTAVCEMRGCWMTLKTDSAPEELKVKVDDGVIVFPVEARGHRAVAEGTLAKIEMDLKRTIAYRKHLADERDEAFDPASVSEPMTYFQVNATGAVIF